MRFVSKALLMAGAALVLARSAEAATYVGATTYFYLTGSYNASFRIDSGSTIVEPDINGFSIQNVIGNYPGSSVGYAADVTFYTTQNGNNGGLEIDDNYGANPIGPLVVTDGPQLFSGSSDSPTFTLGTFSLTEFEGTGRYSLRVTNAALVPEPATWALVIVGFGAIGTAMRRANRRVCVRFAA